MRKLLCSLIVLALAFTAIGAFAANRLNPKNYPLKTVPKSTIIGKQVKQSGPIQADPHTMLNWKAVNKLSPAMNTKIKAQQKGSFVNGTIDTLPYFNGYFLTGDGKNSLYTYSMLGGSPPAGGTTNIQTEIIPLISILEVGGVIFYIFDPAGFYVPPADQDSDANLFAESPIFDATTTYPGPPAQTGQFHDGYSRTQFRKVAAANWHTIMAPNSTTGTVFGPFIWQTFLEFNNGDWTLFCCDTNGNNFPSFDINAISNAFAVILSYPLEIPATTNNIFPLILTDYLFASEGGGCCIGGFHAAQPGTFDPNGVLIWAWATWVPHNIDQGVVNPFGPPPSFGSDMMAWTHEIGEALDDPFVQTNGTLVPAWVDGSVSFAQGNLENGDVIEAMAVSDSITQIPLNVVSGPYLYDGQNLATLEWFSRNPLTGGIYSWPNEGTLSHNVMKPGCQQPFVCSWLYGQGPGGFFFGPPY
jgi:hypothetical protein